MANYCKNKLIILGNENDIAEVKSKIFAKNPNWGEQQKYGSYCRIIIPSSETLKEFQGNENWQPDTSWDSADGVMETNLNEDYDCPDRIEVEFPSKWQPELEFVKFLIGQFPLCEYELSYYDTGFEFAGYLTAKANSECVINHTLDKANILKIAYYEFGDEP